MTESSTVVTRPSVQQLLALALPIVVSRSAQVVVGITDAVMVGALGETALAATTTAGMNTFNILVFPMGVVFVVQSFASQLHGKGDTHAARRYGWYALGVAALAQLACFVAIPFIDDAVELFAYDAEVKALMVSYLAARLMTGGAAVGLEALGAWYGGLSNTTLPMCAQMLAMVLNVFLNWVLITGNLGAPALGVQGAAIASAISTLVAWAVLTMCFVFGVGVPRPVETSSPLVLREALRLLRFGVPSGLNWFVEFLALSFFINAVLPMLGTQTVAALMSVFQLNSVAFMPAFALASAGAVFVGQAIGADHRDDVPRTVRLTLIAAASWMGLIALVYLAAPGAFMALFVAHDTDPVVANAFLEVGGRMLMLSCLWQLFDAASMVLSEALRAAGDTAFALWARCVIAWCVFVPGVWFTVHEAGGSEVAAVLWLATYLGLLAVVLGVRFRSGRWRHIALTEDVVTDR